MAVAFLCAALVLALVVVAAAQAAVVRTPGYVGVTRPIATQPPIVPPVTTLGNGSGVDIFVDAAGTGHVVWTQERPAAPDATVYCRLPRGASACEVLRELIPPGAGELSNDASGPTVTAVNDQLLVMSHRFPQLVSRPDGTTGGSAVYLWTSDDGGETFSTPAIVASARAPNLAVAGDVSGGSVAFGPPESPSIAFANGLSTGGMAVTVVPAGMYTPQGAPLAAGDYGYANLAVVDGLPAIAYADYGGNAFLRRWTGQGDPNDAATWTPQQPLGGFNPKIAVAGTRPVVAVMSGLLASEITLRDLDGPTPPVVINPGGRGTDHRVAGLPDGRVVVSWRGTASVDSPSGVWTRTVGADGIPQSAPVLAGATISFSRMGAGPDGGGFVVGQGDGRTITMAGFGPRMPTGLPGLGGRTGGGALPSDTEVECQRVRIAAVEALVRDGCFLNAATGAAKVSTGQIRLNGLDIVPDAGVQIIVNPRQRTIDTTGNVRVLLRAPGIPDVTLFRGRLNLRLSAARVGAPLMAFPRAVFAPNILGFGISGDVDVRLTDRGVRIPVNLALPRAFGGITGATTLRADNASGLVVESLEFRADGIPLGAATMRRLHVQYKAQGGTSVGNCLRPPTSGARAEPDEWAGVFELQLPPPAKGPSLCGSVRFGQGAFRAATFNLDLPPPGIVLFPGISLMSLGGGLALSPTAIDATMRIAAIPATAGGGLVNLDGRIGATFGSPFTLRGAAQVSAAGVAIGNGDFTLSTDGYLRVALAAGPSIGPLTVRARIAGFVDGPRRQFSLSGRGDVCIEAACLPRSGAVVSTRGVAACLPAPAIPRGAGYRWGEPVIGGVEIWLLSCDMDDYEVGDVRQNGIRAHQAGAPEAVARVRGRPGSVTLRVRGDGGQVPDVDVVSPAGRPVEPAAVHREPSSGALYVGLRRPAAGTWIVRARPETPAIAGVAISHQVVPASVPSARVTGAGRAPRTLTYRARIAARQSVIFAERGRSGTRVIGTARHGARTLRFTPGPGAGGRREIVALIAQNGLMRSERVVARYVAPNPPPVGRAMQLRVRRAGARALATWRPGAGLAAQRVQARVSDGRVISRTLPAGARRLVVPGLTRGDRVTVRVVGQARDGRQGRAAQAALRIR